MRQRKPAPLIGITTYAREPFDGGAVQVEVFRVPAAYVDAVQRAGGLPLLVSPSNRDVARLVEVLDGLLLTGGGDISPARYGEDRHPSVYGVDDERDTLELELARAWVKTSKPLLGICRGIHVLNVALGGSLHQNLPDVERFGAVNHGVYPLPPTKHTVTLEPTSKLRSELEMDVFTVTSRHHQAVNRLGKGLVMVGRADDGIIEAVELPSHPWCIGIQWHPEIDAGTEPIHQRIFNRFVSAAMKESS